MRERKWIDNVKKIIIWSDDVKSNEIIYEEVDINCPLCQEMCIRDRFYFSVVKPIT